MTLQNSVTKIYEAIMRKLFPNRFRPTTRTFRFYKQHDGKWFVDMPEWKQDKQHLQMVEGADDFLESIRPSGSNQVYLQVSLSSQSFEDSIRIIKMDDDPFGDGADYWYSTPTGPKTMWLCNVTDWYYGYMPEEIFVKQVV